MVVTIVKFMFSLCPYFSQKAWIRTSNQLRTDGSLVTLTFSETDASDFTEDRKLWLFHGKIDILPFT